MEFSLRHFLLSVTLKYPPQNVFLKEASNNKSPTYRTVSIASSCCKTDCMQTLLVQCEQQPIMSFRFLFETGRCFSEPIPNRQVTPLHISQTSLLNLKIPGLARLSFW